MAIPKLDLDLFEGNILDSCWRVGGRARKSHSAFAINRNEIENVDIVACCNQIIDLIEEPCSEARNKRNVSFKDISRLAYGATDIYRCQVDFLLGDTKLLMDQMKRTNLDFVLTTTKTVVVKESENRGQRKRKRVFTNKSKITVSKRPRLQEPELLNTSAHKYFRKILFECQMWQAECTQQVQVDDLNESVEPLRSCTQSNSYHTFTFTEEIQIHQEQSNIIPTDGFGDGENLDLTIFNELFPKDAGRESCKEFYISKINLINLSLSIVKRRSVTQDPTDILPDKMPRLEELDIFQADNAIMTQIFPHNIEPAEITQICCEPSILSLVDPIEEIIFSQPKTSRKRKLIVDKRIEYTQEELQKHRRKYLDDHNSRVVLVRKPSELRKTPNELLCKLNNNIIFPYFNNHTGVKSSEDEMQFEAESTLRTIFGSEFTDTLSKQILVKPAGQRNSINQEVYINQPVPLEMEDVLTPPMPPIDVNEPINNNNLYDHSIHCENNNFDTHSVMMDLLNIWRNNPEIPGINANDFIKSFPDRIKASLAFLHLLYLVRDHFIEITKLANSIEMDQISLGKESAKLIENILQSKT
ncbi:hypothetical protein KR084_011976 [Drosophila pseudotakahashii]|nr:hypothetical protein KR084_011976 [Drosophila pseudotakahashii]